AAQRLEDAAEQLKAELGALNPDQPNPIRYMLTAIGRSAGGGGPRNDNQVAPAVSHQAEVSLALLTVAERRDITANRITSRWREMTGMIPDAVELDFNANAFDAGDPISIELRGRDVDD